MSKLKAHNLHDTYLEAYIGYLQNANAHHTVGIGNGKARPPSVNCYVKPFNVALPASVLAKASASQAAQAELAEKLVNYVYSTLGTNEAIGLRDYSPARIVHMTGKLTKGRPVNSRRTTKPYNSYYAAQGGTASKSFPFGDSVTGVILPEIEVFQLVRNSYLVDGAMPAGTNLTLLKEKFSART